MSKADALLVGHHNHGPAAELHTYKHRLTTRAHVHVVLYNIRMRTRGALAAAAATSNSCC
jgi:hypothetical protein